MYALYVDIVNYYSAMARHAVHADSSNRPADVDMGGVLGVCSLPSVRRDTCKRRENFARIKVTPPRRRTETMMATQTKLPVADEDLYAEMSIPFADGDAANKALEAFYNEVYELRKKHRLANVLIVAQDAIHGSGRFMSNTHFGSETEKESMAAWLLGKVQAERQDIIRRAMEQGMEQALKVHKSRK